MRLRITATAYDELEEIYRYIAKDNAGAAKTVLLRLEQVIARIARFPSIGRIIDPAGTRIFPASPFPYLVFYTVEGEEVIVRNVRHGRRRRPSEG